MPGSSGRTCSCPAASSSTSKIFFPAAWPRQRAARASVPGGIWLAGTPAVSSKLASASAGSDRPLPRGVGVQRQEELPVREGSGQPVRGVHREGGLADPGHPADRVNAHDPPPSSAVSAHRAISWPSSAWRPVKPAISRGSVRLAAAADPVPAAPAAAASTSSAGARPRAAATNSSRAGPSRPSAPASSTAVSLRAVALIPRSRSLIARWLTRAASASSSWVSPASSRSRRSSPPNLSPACSATGPPPTGPLPPPPPGASPTRVPAHARPHRPA